MARVVAAAGQMAERNGARLWMLFFQLATASLHLQALDFERAARLARDVVDEARAIPHPYCELAALIVLAATHLTSGEHETASRHLMAVAAHMDSGWPRDAHLRMPLLHGLAECWLERADLDRARGAAAELWDTAAQPGERTFVALSARMLARVAVAGGDRDRARAEIGRALGLIQNGEASLAAWRTHATAAEICELQGDSGETMRHWKASAETLRELALALADYPTLSQHLLTNPAARSILERADG